MAGDAEHLQLERDGDARLHLGGSHARRLENDFDLRGGHVRKGVDREVPEGDDPRAQEQHGECEHQDPLGQRELDELLGHHSAAPAPASHIDLSAATPRVATCSSPSRSPVIPAAAADWLTTLTRWALKPSGTATNR